MKKIFLSFLFLLQVYCIQSQNFEYHPSLVSVSFSGVLNTNYIPIRFDNNTGEFSAPHFIKSSNTRNPVAYVCGTKPTVSAKLLFQCSNPNPPSKIWIRGIHEKLNADDVKFTFAPKEVAFAVGTEIEYPATQSDNPFKAKKIDFYDYTYTIKWEYSFSSSGPWAPAGESVNPIYVTLNPPKPKNPAAGYDYFQTLLHIGCKYGIGATSHASLYVKVRNYFSTRTVLRADQLPLKYYGSWDCHNTTTQELISNLDGQCGAWASFFIDILKIQGYQSDNNYITMKSDYGNFYIKEWVFSSNPGSSGVSIYSYLNLSFIPNTEPLEEYKPWSPAGGYVWQGSTNPESPQVTDNNPLLGQNSPRPQSRFNNHQFVKIFSQYYDPSYGVLYANTAKMDEAISGFYLPNPSGSYWKDVVLKNPVGTNIKLSSMSY